MKKIVLVLFLVIVSLLTYDYIMYNIDVEADPLGDECLRIVDEEEAFDCVSKKEYEIKDEKYFVFFRGELKEYKVDSKDYLIRVPINIYQPLDACITDVSTAGASQEYLLLPRDGVFAACYAGKDGLVIFQEKHGDYKKAFKTMTDRDISPDGKVDLPNIDEMEMAY